MSAFAIANLHDVRMGADIVAYLENIDATLAPFGGRFRIHGAPPDVVEGTFSGDLIMLEFPDIETARAWYRSEAYQAIQPLRTRNSAGSVILVEGVPEGHRATDILKG